MNKFDKHGRITFLELFVLAATLLLAYATIVPPIVKSRRALKIELAALNLMTIEDAVEILERRNAENPEFSRDSLTYADVSQVVTGLGNLPLEWPSEADLATLDLASTNGPSIVMEFPENCVTVRVSDASTPR